MKQLSIKNKLTNRLETIDLSELNVQVYSISKAEIQSALSQLKKLSHPTMGPGGQMIVPPASTGPPHRCSSSDRRRPLPDDQRAHPHELPGPAIKSPTVAHTIPPLSFPDEPLSPHLLPGLERQKTH